MTYDFRLIPLTQGLFAKVDTADFIWLSQWKWCAAWVDPSHVYAIRTERVKGGRKTRQVKMHRVILNLHFGDPLHGDHINGDTLDNRRGNLRVATREQNGRNRAKQKNGKSLLKGAYFAGNGRWRSSIYANGKSLGLGSFRSEEEAHRAYCEASSRLHLEFGRTA